MEIRFACFILLMVLLTGCDMYYHIPDCREVLQARTNHACLNSAYITIINTDQSVHHAYLTYSFVSTDSNTIYYEYHNG